MPNPAEIEAAYRAREEADSALKNGMQPGELLRGDDGEVQGQVTDVRYTGMIPMWHTQTGVLSFTLPYMMYEQMKKRLPGGKPAFTFTNPGIWKPPSGGLMCLLHPDHPGAEKLFEMGFEACEKNHIPSQRALEMHMRKHSQAWDTIKQQRDYESRDETREFQKSQVDIMKQLLANANGTAVPAEEATPEPEPEKFTEQCDDCAFVAEAGGVLAAHNKMGAHRRKAHPLPV
jgi:hypothetical protein